MRLSDIAPACGADARNGRGMDLADIAPPAVAASSRTGAEAVVCRLARRVAQPCRGFDPAAILRRRVEPIAPCCRANGYFGWEPVPLTCARDAMPSGAGDA